MQLSQYLMPTQVYSPKNRPQHAFATRKTNIDTVFFQARERITDEDLLAKIVNITASPDAQRAMQKFAHTVVQSDGETIEGLSYYQAVFTLATDIETATDEIIAGSHAEFADLLRQSVANTDSESPVLPPTDDAMSQQFYDECDQYFASMLLYQTLQLVLHSQAYTNNPNNYRHVSHFEDAIQMLIRLSEVGTRVSMDNMHDFGRKIRALGRRPLWNKDKQAAYDLTKSELVNQEAPHISAYQSGSALLTLFNEKKMRW